MIDHIQPTNNMNVVGRLSTKELTRRSSCNSPLGIRKNSILRLQNNRLSCSNINISSNGDALAETPQLANKRVGLASRRVSASLLSTTTAPTPRKVSAQRPLLLPRSVQCYIEDKALLTNCKDIYVCDGSEKEKEQLLKMMAENGMVTPLRKYENCWLARTDARDVARVESKTFICTRNKHEVVARGQQQVAGDKQAAQLGNWMHIDELDELAGQLLRNCMSGRTMYVIPFSMGPLGGKLSKVGIQLTDSPYVVVSMHVMTRVARKVFQIIGQQKGEFVRCFHSVGCPLPLPRPLVNNWPCNPEQTIISHIPERKEIISYGSGYGGNSLLGKKCFALRLGSLLGRQEGWLAEHMLILGITNPHGAKKYIAAAFPSACGKTNLAMMTPTLPGYKIECVGDDIAWMRFDDKGVLRAINPEAGFFGVAPGTNERSNPNAMRTIEKNTIFTNVAETSDGDFYWEGLEDKLVGGELRVKDWQGRDWQPGAGAAPAAHPNSRFCAPSSQCPMIDPQWESAEGVPIAAIIFGGRPPEGVPLVYESFDWNHGIYVGASMRSESTAAAEHKAKTIMHDPFAMRPFFGYNFGHYLDHWLSFGRAGAQNLGSQVNAENAPAEPRRQLPKIFHVNWFRKSGGQFLWPGFGENSRVLDWICRRVDGEQCARETPIGFVPTQDALNLDGLGQEVDLAELFSISTEFWLQEQAIVDRYLRTNVGLDLPAEISEQSDNLKQRLLEGQKEQ